MLAGKEAGLGQTVMGVYRSSDNNGIQTEAVDKLFVVGRAFDIGVEGENMFQAIFTQVADCFKVAVGKPSEIADEIRSPISAAHYSNGDWLAHTFVAGPTKLSAIGAV